MTITYMNESKSIKEGSQVAELLVVESNSLEPP